MLHATPRCLKRMLQIALAEIDDREPKRWFINVAHQRQFHHQALRKWEVSIE
jgi:hypothetical protein